MLNVALTNLLNVLAAFKESSSSSLSLLSVCPATCTRRARTHTDTHLRYFKPLHASLTARTDDVLVLFKRLRRQIAHSETSMRFSRIASLCALLDICACCDMMNLCGFMGPHRLLLLTLKADAHDASAAGRARPLYTGVRVCVFALICYCLTMISCYWCSSGFTLLLGGRLVYCVRVRVCASVRVCACV